MNTKQRIFVSALADGVGLEAAAGEAGYNLAYARRKAAEPAVKAVVDRLTAARAAKRPSEALSPGSAHAEPGQVPEVLWSMINDPATEAMQRVGAVRALIAYERANPPKEEPQPVIIVDDIATKCRHCVYYKTVQAARQRMRQKRDG